MKTFSQYIFERVSKSDLDQIEKYADKEDTCVEHYFDHVAPFVVQKNFKYVGESLSDPYSVSVPWNYEKGVRTDPCFGLGILINSHTYKW